MARTTPSAVIGILNKDYDGEADLNPYIQDRKSVV